MMSGKDGDAAKEIPSAARKTPLLGARALLSRQLNSASPSPGRLPSLRPARDLTLGASPKLSLSVTPKRTFTPNIPTRRTKQEPKDDASPTAGNSGERRRRDGGRGRGRGEGRGRGRGDRGKPNIVQASSIFSMGVGPVEKQRIGQVVSTPSFGSSGGREGVSGVKIKKERGDEVDEDESKKVLKMLQTSGNIDDDVESDAGAMPVQLPLTFHALRMKEKEAESAALETDVKGKSEPMEVDLVDSGKASPVETLKKPVKQVPIKKEVSDEMTLSNVLSAASVGDRKLLFFQFPDVLPIKLTSGNQEEPMSVEESPNDQTATPEKPKEPKRLSLKDASEGYIGKLQILRSGKARLLMGDVSLDVTMGTPCGFLQDVVAVHTEDSRSEMICLGHVNHRLICTPDFEQLLST
ncbi:DNA-directed RNA polymerase III subunit RPC4-like [Orbicella faveolata]|uniref:DNA-directed RNA polymerase III subunit RPC4-like n=1 Tax=Orbicella faveolata TaxID=48498 RepID=UPI0009E4B822|nr:DNA-directed RNA polymerase III subunit RPC4-like [Orbicella faveolata]